MLGSLVAEGKFAGMDASVRQLALAHQSPFGIAFFGAATLLGSKGLLVVLGVLCGWWLSNRSRALVILVAFGGLMSAEFVDVLKVMFDVARPPAGMASQRSLSFPSGHVAGAAAITTLLSYVAWRHHRALRYVVSLSALLVSLVAASRVYLDKHWASDTLGGTLIGLALGVLYSALFEWMFRRDRNEEPIV